MERDIYQKLIAWKNSPRRKPLVLRGARQVGKTYILKLFGKQAYRNTIYINFEKMAAAKSFFQKDLKPERIIRDLKLFSKQEISPQQTLIIFDEVQDCPEALNSLKYFQEEANDYHIVAAGSLLGVKLADSKGFPVGKVNFLELYPLTFSEFLVAMDFQQLQNHLKEKKDFEPLATILHEQLIDLLKQYFLTGGMPEVVANYLQHHDYEIAREIQHEILLSYTQDFAKHAPLEQVNRISTLWDAIPSQLAKEYKKFKFADIYKSARAREYEIALQWLIDAGLIYKVYHLAAAKLPLDAYSDRHMFKLYMLDCGLLAAKSGLDPATIIDGHALFTEFKGAFTENFVAQQLATVITPTLYYWTSAGNAEVDFVLSHKQKIYPIEVKAGTSLRSKSLSVFAEKYPMPQYRISLGHYGQRGKIIDLPLYAVTEIF